MITKDRDWFLQQIGIKQYKLRYPHVLQGEMKISLKLNTRLIFVAENPPSLQEPLIRDVLRIINIQSEEVMILVPKQLRMLPIKVNCPGWLMGIKSDYPFNGMIFTTVAFNELINSSSEKRFLWQQICKYDNLI